MNTTLDPTRRKHGGNPESDAAFKRCQAVVQRERVLAAVKAAGSHGITCKELARKWGCDMNAISGRFSELLERGLIVRNGEKREWCAVFVAQPIE